MVGCPVTLERTDDRVLVSLALIRRSLDFVYEISVTPGVPEELAAKARGHRALISVLIPELRRPASDQVGSPTLPARRERTCRPSERGGKSL